MGEACALRGRSSTEVSPVRGGEPQGIAMAPTAAYVSGIRQLDVRGLRRGGQCAPAAMCSSSGCFPRSRSSAGYVAQTFRRWTCVGASANRQVSTTPRSISAWPRSTAAKRCLRDLISPSCSATVTAGAHRHARSPPMRSHPSHPGWHRAAMSLRPQWVNRCRPALLFAGRARWSSSGCRCRRPGRLR
jgi:hypothetical protein